MTRLYFEWMWFWCWACYRAYLALPAAMNMGTRYHQFTMWLLAYGGAYAYSTRKDFHLCRFFFQNDGDCHAAWEKHLAVTRPQRDTP